MKNTRQAFTLVELLTVIAIIGILAAMLLPALSHARTAAQKAKAKLEMSALAGAIEAYDQAYGRFPVSQAAQTQAAENASAIKNGDFTYGGHLPAPTGGTIPVGTVMDDGGVLTNNEVMAILMDITNYPASPTISTVNTNHVKNPRQTKFLNQKMTSDTVSPGIGSDLVYRDPWGNPYVITMDLNYDEECNDSLYGTRNFSQETGNTGYNGLYDNVDLGNPGNHFQYHGKVMIWSAGPYPGKNSGVDIAAKANSPVNKNHVLSWQ